MIPEKADQAANRKKKGGKGGRPLTHDKMLYMCRYQGGVELTSTPIRLRPLCPDWTTQRTNININRTPCSPTLPSRAVAEGRCG